MQHSERQSARRATQRDVLKNFQTNQASTIAAITPRPMTPHTRPLRSPPFFLRPNGDAEPNVGGGAAPLPTSDKSTPVCDGGNGWLALRMSDSYRISTEPRRIWSPLVSTVS